MTACGGRPCSSTPRRVAPSRSPPPRRSLQVYTGNKLDGTLSDRDGHTLGHRGGIALECQGHPDAPNQPTFPSAELRPGEEYRATTTWRFVTA